MTTVLLTIAIAISITVLPLMGVTVLTLRSSEQFTAWCREQDAPSPSSINLEGELFEGPAPRR